MERRVQLACEGSLDPAGGGEKLGCGQRGLVDGMQGLEAGLQTQGFVRFCAFRSVWMKDIRTGEVDTLHEAGSE